MGPQPGATREGLTLAITDLPLFSMLRTRMQWHQERQRLLAENVSNSDTQGYRPRDLTPLQFDRKTPTTTTIALERTEAGHILVERLVEPAGVPVRGLQRPRFGR